MLEAGFLVLLAVVVGFADLDPPLIILVMTVGWLLVSLIEYFAWRQTQALVVSRFERCPGAADGRKGRRGRPATTSSAAGSGTDAGRRGDDRRPACGRGTTRGARGSRQGGADAVRGR